MPRLLNTNLLHGEAMIALLITLFMGFPEPSFQDRFWPWPITAPHSPLDFHPVTRFQDPPPKNYRYGKGSIEGSCKVISSRVTCNWERARV